VSNCIVLRSGTLCAALLVSISIALLKDSARADALDNWTPSPLVYDPVAYRGIYPTSVTYGNGRYVTVGVYSGDDAGFIQTSEDGFSWTMRTSHNYAVLDLYDVVFDNGVFLAVGWGGGLGDPNLCHSTNGINWIPHSIDDGNGSIYRVISGGGNFLAVGKTYETWGTNTHNIYTSLDGITWVLQSSGFSDEIHDVAYGAGRFVAVDGANHIYNSPTGITWTRKTYSNGSYVNFCFDRFIVPIGTGANLVSFDGLAWSPVSNNSGATFTRVIYAGGYYVALSLYNVFTSTDSVNWIRRNLPNPPTNSLQTFTALNFLAGKVFIGGYTWTTNVIGPRLPVLYVSDSVASPNIIPSLKINPGNPPNLTISGSTNRSYRIEYLTDLQSNNWQTLSTFTLANSPSTWLDSTATNFSRYYRAVLLP
jgi:hypothetical protein